MLVNFPTLMINSFEILTFENRFLLYELLRKWHQNLCFITAMVSSLTSKYKLAEKFTPSFLLLKKPLNLTK